MTVLADESTDIVNHKRLVVYAQIISEDMTPKTWFVANVECQDATGSGRPRWLNVECQDATGSGIAVVSFWQKNVHSTG